METLRSDDFRQLITVLEVVPIPVFIVVPRTHEVAMANSAGKRTLAKAHVDDAKPNILDLFEPAAGILLAELVDTAEKDYCSRTLSLPLKNELKHCVVRSASLNINCSEYQVVSLEPAAGGREDRFADPDDDRLLCRYTEFGHLVFLGKMTTELTHEINNAISVIGFCLEKLSDTDSRPSPDLFSKAKKMTDRIARIVRTVGILGRDGSRDSFSPIRLDEIVAETLELCSARLKTRGITVETNVPSNIRIMCRPVQISQVLVNLINNAADAVADVSEKWVRMTVTQEQSVVFISVEDSGPGIPKHLRTRIMAPLFTTKEAGKGTGLGLHLSERIVREHGGRLRLDENSANTRFVVELPQNSEKGH